MPTSRWRYSLLVLVLLGVVACGQAGPAGQATSNTGTAGLSHGGPIVDQVSFIDHLRGTGLQVEVAEEVQQPFFQAKGTLLRISGGALAQTVELQVYNYDEAAAAEADASQLGPDGNPRTMMITWVAPPHFFRKERVVVLYNGSDQTVIDLLTQALGPQFAGS